MDTLVFITVILGILKMSQADMMLRCIECEHFGWNQTYNFNGAQNVYQLLQSKYNPACSQDNPRDQNMYQQNMQHQSNQQQTQQLQPQQPGNSQNTFYQNRYDIRETICPVYAETNRCNYIDGIATVYFPSYQGEMNLAMHVRNCIDAATDVEDGCYQRTSRGYPEVINFLQDRLQFLGNIEVKHFTGKQCYCRSNMCYIVSAGRNIVASSSSLILAVIAFIVLK